MVKKYLVKIQGLSRGRKRKCNNVHTYIDMVLNIIYFGYKFDLKSRVLNWF